MKKPREANITNGFEQPWCDIRVNTVKNTSLLHNNETRSHFKKMINVILLISFFNPLWEYYIRAPSWAGGWEGRSVEEICATLTPRTTSGMWIANLVECEIMVNNHFMSFIVVGYMILFCCCLYRVASVLSSWATMFMIRKHVTDPILQTIESLKETRLKLE